MHLYSSLIKMTNDNKKTFFDFFLTKFFSHHSLKTWIRILTDPFNKVGDLLYPEPDESRISIRISYRHTCRSASPAVQCTSCKRFILDTKGISFTLLSLKKRFLVNFPFFCVKFRPLHRVQGNFKSQQPQQKKIKSVMWMCICIMGGHLDPDPYGGKKNQQRNNFTGKLPKKHATARVT